MENPADRYLIEELRRIANGIESGELKVPLYSIENSCVETKIVIKYADPT